MTDFTSIYIFLFVLVYSMNVLPGLMPATWLILAFFFIHFNLLLLPVVILGACAAVLGRITLATLSRNYFRKLFSIKSLENYETLGKFADTHQKLTIPVVFLYAFLPIPSNQVFIIAGLAKLNLKIIAFSFFIGRLLSYTFWVSAAHIAADRLENIFTQQYSSFTTIIVEIIGLGIIYFVGKINWKKLLKV